MVGLDSGLARIAGVVLLVAFIALGALAIATPDHRTIPATTTDGRRARRRGNRHERTGRGRLRRGG